MKSIDGCLWEVFVDNSTYMQHDGFAKECNVEKDGISDPEIKIMHKLSVHCTFLSSDYNQMIMRMHNVKFKLSIITHIF